MSTDTNNKIQLVLEFNQAEVTKIQQDGQESFIMINSNQIQFSTYPDITTSLNHLLETCNKQKQSLFINLKMFLLKKTTFFDDEEYQSIFQPYVGDVKKTIIHTAIPFPVERYEWDKQSERNKHSIWLSSGGQIMKLHFDQGGEAEKIKQLIDSKPDHIILFIFEY